MAATTFRTFSMSANTKWRSKWEYSLEDEEEVERLACEEEGRCKSMLVRRKQEGEEEEGWWWEGEVRREMEAGPEEIWETVSRFGGMKRWNAKAEVCEVVEGEDGEAGCVRFCAGDGRWVKEKLLAMHPEQRRFTYSILDSSYGFEGYKATLAILRASTPARAVAHWTFRLRPVPHTLPPCLLAFLTSIFDSMMASLERSLHPSATTLS